MMTPIIYDAFSGIGGTKKWSLIKFLSNQSDDHWMTEEKATKAVEYALKEVPSFGGCILTLEKEGSFIAAIVITKTGMDGILPSYLMVLSATLPVFRKYNLTKVLIKRALTITKGELSSLVRDFEPQELLLENLNQPTTAKAAKVKVPASTAKAS